MSVNLSLYCGWGSLIELWGPKRVSKPKAKPEIDAVGVDDQATKPTTSSEAAVDSDDAGLFSENVVTISVDNSNSRKRGRSRMTQH